MSEQRDTYEATKARLEEISAAARAKDVTLEKSIELLEEAVRLANLCTEHVDQAETFAVPAADVEGEDAAAPEAEPAGVPGFLAEEGAVFSDGETAEPGQAAAEVAGDTGALEAAEEPEADAAGAHEE